MKIVLGVIIIIWSLIIIIAEYGRFIIWRITRQKEEKFIDRYKAVVLYRLKTLLKTVLPSLFLVAGFYIIYFTVL